MRILFVLGAVFYLLSSAHLRANESGFYIGTDYTYSQFNYRGANKEVLADTFSGYAPYIGFRSSGNLGMELGYMGMIEESKSLDSSFTGFTNLTSETSFRGGYFDGTLTLPAWDYMSLIGSIGYQWIEGQLYLKEGSTQLSEEGGSAHGARFGLGAEFHIIEDLSVRVMARYTTTRFLYVEGYTQLSVGLKYQF